ncbi:MAG: hypothetical protein H0A75_00210 [Candidatus Methanofishera endochildressiae]|uniref:Uncharacterized protein n=1 Tax=Candidatus Methanofishera endochildressiae TaxID=2738884 RepID=A0A7Z0MMD6_9GAMM|nr:hypothetical protein [Candidatus Methanofishera endochildressiae]
MKDLDNAMMYDNSPRSGRGVGKEQWGTKAIYIIHPTGFSFKESQSGAHAYSPSGLTIANLKRGNKYELALKELFLSRS